MRFRRSILKALSMLFLAGCCAFMANGVLAADHGRSIEFSAPKSDELSTNLHQLTSKKDRLGQLEEDAYKTFQSFAPNSSLDAAPAPSVAPVAPQAINTKRIKQLMERNKNYLWMTPDELVPGSGTTVEDILKVPQFGPDGVEKKSKSAMERYYEKLGTRPINGMTGDAVEDDSANLFGKPKDRDTMLVSDPNLPHGLKESAQALNSLFRDDSEENLGDPKRAQKGQNSFSDIFGLGQPVASREQELEHKKVMDEFHNLLDPSWHPTAGVDSLHPFEHAVDAPTATSLPTSAGLSQPAKNPFDSLSPPSAPLAPLPPSAPVDVTVQALGQPDPGLATKVEIPKQTVGRPSFDFPKRPGL